MAIEGYEVVISGTLAGQFVQTVQHLVGDPPTPGNPFEIASAISAELATGDFMELFCSCLPTDYHGTSLRVKKITSGGGPTAIRLSAEWTAGPDGVRVGEISSAQVNPLVTFIGTASPSKTGRVFMPGVSEDDIDQMQLVSTLVTQLYSCWNNWVAGYSIGGFGEFKGAIYRRAGASPALQMDEIAYTQVSPLIGTQRRRLHPV